MKQDKVFKLRSSIFDKLNRCDELFNQIKYNNVLVIDNDNLTKKNIESLNISKKVSFYDNIPDSVQYLNTTNTAPDIIFVDEGFLHGLIEKYNYNKESTKLIVLTSLTNTINTIFDIIHKPISYSAIQKIIK
jgi:alpha-N-acetylglucosamine transferase